MKDSRFEPQVLMPLANVNDSDNFMSDLFEQTVSGKVAVVKALVKPKKRRKISKR